MASSSSIWGPSCSTYVIPGSIRPRVDLLKAKAKAVSEQILKSLAENQSQSKNIKLIVDTLTDIETQIKKTLVEKDGTLIAKVEIKGESKKYFYLFQNPSDTEKIQVLFDKNVSTYINDGCFKILRECFDLSTENTTKLFASKDYGLTPQDKSNLERFLRFYNNNVNQLSTEVKALYLINLRLQNEKRIAEANIPGTAKVLYSRLYLGKKNGRQKEKFLKIEEFYPGGSLQDNLNNTKLAYDDRVIIFIELAKILAEMHRRGFSHNDVKPENVMLDKDNKPILIDFGGTTYGLEERELVSRPLAYMPLEMIHRPYLDRYDELDLLLQKNRDARNILQADLTKIDQEIQSKEALAASLCSTEDIEKINIELEELNGRSAEMYVDVESIQLEIEAQNIELSRLHPMFKQSLNLKGFIPQKNDNFALGIIGTEFLPDWKNDPVVRPVIEGLLANESIRWTAEMAYHALSSK